MQEKSEHAWCGLGNEPSGFSYDPEQFIQEGCKYLDIHIVSFLVAFYNFSWKDFGCASLPFLIDNVKVLAFALKQGKVLVHCHSGLGKFSLQVS